MIAEVFGISQMMMNAGRVIGQLHLLQHPADHITFLLEIHLSETALGGGLRQV